MTLHKESSLKSISISQRSDQSNSKSRITNYEALKRQRMILSDADENKKLKAIKIKEVELGKGMSTAGYYIKHQQA